MCYNLFASVNTISPGASVCEYVKVPEEITDLNETSGVHWALICCLSASEILIRKFSCRHKSVQQFSLRI